MERHERQARRRSRELADALVKLGGLDMPPARFVAGADAVEAAETKAKTLLSQAEAYRDLSSFLDHSPT